jgi:hypothetical protein
MHRVPCWIVFLWSSFGRSVHLRFFYGIGILRLCGCPYALEVVFLLKRHDCIVISFLEFIHFRRQCVLSLQHNTIICIHELIVFPLCQEHVCVLIVVAMLLVLDDLIKVFIHVIVLEWRSYLLITLLFMFPLPDLRDQIPSKVLISWLEIIFLPGSELFLHGHPFHQFLHSLHHQVEHFIS